MDMINLLTFIAQSSGTGDIANGDIVKTLSAIVFWVGGYAAAPLIFMATLGVFKNIAGMGSGMMKGVRGKVNERAGGRLKKDKSIRADERERKLNYAAQRSKYNYRNRKAIKNGEMETAGRYSNAQWKDTNNAIGEARLRQADPMSQKGEAVEAAAKMQASAGAINAELEFTAHFEKAVKTGVDPYTARQDALKQVRKSLTKNLDDGTATQSEVTGTLLYLGRNKAAGEVTAIQDHIDGMAAGGNATKATQQYASALGNSETYGTLTGLNAGYKFVPSAFVPSATKPTRPSGETAKFKRSEAMLTEQLSKVATVDSSAWTEAAEVHGADKVAERIKVMYDMGGKTREGLQIARVPPPPAAGATAADIAKHKLISDLHTELTSAGIPPEFLK